MTSIHPVPALVNDGSACPDTCSCGNVSTYKYKYTNCIYRNKIIHLPEFTYSSLSCSAFQLSPAT